MKRRCVRAASGSTLSARDTEVLRSIAWAGFLSTTQVQALHFPSRRVAQRRLRALLDHALVRARLQGDAVLHRDNIYTLTPAGSRYLVDRGASEDVATPGRVPTWRALPHASAIRDVFVAFRERHRAGDLALVDFLFEGDLAATPGFAAAGLRPDALAVHSTRGGERRVAIEVDLGSEPTRVLAAKLGKYNAIMGSLVHEVVFGLGGARRVLHGLVEQAGLGAHVHLVQLRDLGRFLRERCGGALAPASRPFRRVR